MTDIVPGVTTTIRTVRPASPARTRAAFVDDESGLHRGLVSTVWRPGRVAQGNPYRQNQRHGHPANTGPRPAAAQPVPV
jgi:hypothetical protein